MKNDIYILLVKFQVSLCLIVGPGSYQPNQTQINHMIQDQRSPYFKSKTMRFDKIDFQKEPMANIELVGTTKKKEKRFSVSIAHEISKKHKIRLKKTIASIPCMNIIQNLARVIPENGHTGTKEDKVGPTSYKPSYFFNRKKGTAGSVKYSLDKIQRDVFGTKISVPGPGQYESNNKRKHKSMQILIS